MNISTALSRPSSIAVFTVLVMGLFSERSAPSLPLSLFYPRHEPGDERGALGQRLDIDVFVQRVGAVAHRAEAVQCGNPESGREISVRAAAGPAFAQLLAQCPGDLASLTI